MIIPKLEWKQIDNNKHYKAQIKLPFDTGLYFSIYFDDEIEKYGLLMCNEYMDDYTNEELWDICDILDEVKAKAQEWHDNKWREFYKKLENN
jgi:hypothetical protein